MSDLGLTHVAFAVKDLEASVRFYQAYANMQVVHRRPGDEPGAAVAWMSDLTRPFVVVLIQAPGLSDTPLGPFGHLGVGCASRAEVDRLAEQARGDGRLRSAPKDSGPPVGYWAYVADPDGNTLELAFGQDVGLAIELARSAEQPA